MNFGFECVGFFVLILSCEGFEGVVDFIEFGGGGNVC